MLKNYIFDLGGVLLDIRMKNAYECFVAYGQPPAELEPGGSVYKLMEDYQLGYVTTAEFCQQIASKCAASSNRARQRHAISKKHGIPFAWESQTANCKHSVACAKWKVLQAFRF